MQLSRYISTDILSVIRNLKCFFSFIQNLSSLVNSVLPYSSGAHLLSHTVSSAVPSPDWVLTVVFGMGTGVSPNRIGTRKIKFYLLDNSTVKHIFDLLLLP